jgi:DNA-binding CsgD family transcriptional regulator
VPAGVELSAYRIVQEALSNAGRHARDAGRVDVEVRFEPERLTVTVTDDGLLVAPPAGDEERSAPGERWGHGLLGMSERVTMLGGTSPPSTSTSTSTRRCAPAPAALTPRETEVLTLIARGQSNAEITRSLVLAEETVKTHVSRILARTACDAVAAAYAGGAKLNSWRQRYGAP